MKKTGKTFITRVTAAKYRIAISTATSSHKTVMKSKFGVETFGRKNFNRFSNQWACEIYSAEIKRWRHENLDPKAISLHERMKDQIEKYVTGQLLQIVNTPGI